jgi:hypothetical protein
MDEAERRAREDSRIDHERVYLKGVATTSEFNMKNKLPQ